MTNVVESLNAAPVSAAVKAALREHERRMRDDPSYRELFEKYAARYDAVFNSRECE